MASIRHFTGDWLHWGRRDAQQKMSQVTITSSPARILSSLVSSTVTYPVFRPASERASDGGDHNVMYRAV